ncbi:extracellular solute-binding protein [Salinilacihabitans rarus]|uniref:extracellular solute-binding protein n=1 Tax=Salinilacihabitans rarus TaxID=2961596 RepID=UPI0020C88D38|nr:extracellular solute-binding protein [Salinilacihabitans rarus]
MTSRGTTRRSLLAATGATLVGSVAGCLAGGRESVAVLSAGSLATAFEKHVGPAFADETGVDLRGEYYGTNAIVRMVVEGTKAPDVVVSADATLLRDRLYDEFATWDLEFAANSVGIAYDPDTSFGAALDAGEPWYDLLLASDPGDVVVGDPDLDPLGYRAVQAFDLAERVHDRPGFREAALERVVEEPDEPQMLAGVESGSRAAAIVYRNMAVDHGVAFQTFPDAYNFADPARADWYATASYAPEGEDPIEGRPVVYNTTVLGSADAPDAARTLVSFLAERPDLLEGAGLTVSDDLPRLHGDAPAALSDLPT